MVMQMLHILLKLNKTSKPNNKTSIFNNLNINLCKFYVNFDLKVMEQF